MVPVTRSSRRWIVDILSMPTSTSSGESGAEAAGWDRAAGQGREEAPRVGLANSEEAELAQRGWRWIEVVERDLSWVASRGAVWWAERSQRLLTSMVRRSVSKACEVFPPPWWTR